MCEGMSSPETKGEVDDDDERGDKLMAMHAKLDELSLAMFESLRQLPEEARTSAAPHPVVLANATALVNKSREFDGLVDELGRSWTTQTAAEQMDLLASLRHDHDVAGTRLVVAHSTLAKIIAANTAVLDSVHTAHIKAGKLALHNKHIRYPTQALRARVLDLLQELEDNEEERERDVAGEDSR